MKTFNGIEAALWLAMAIVVLLRYRRSSVGTRRIAHGTSAFLALFAASDLIEIHTGAWWRPVSLLILKGVCLIALAAGFGLLWRRSTAKPDGKNPAEADGPGQ